MNVFGQMIQAVFENTPIDFSTVVKGMTWFNTTSNKIKYHDGTASREIMDTDSVQSISNKTLIQPKSDVLTISHQITPSAPSSGNVKVYVKNTKKAYILDDAGVERPLGSGGGSGNLLWEKTGSVSPDTELVDGFHFETFWEVDDAEIYAFINVPSDYVQGTQIKLTNGSFFCPTTSGQIYFKTETTLIQNNTTILGSYPNKYTSTNVTANANAIANTLTAIPDLDLTDSVGKINGVSVVAGDKLRIRLFRFASGESTKALGGIKLLINNFEMKFTA